MKKIWMALVGLAMAVSVAGCGGRGDLGASGGTGGGSTGLACDPTPPNPASPTMPTKKVVVSPDYIADGWLTASEIPTQDMSTFWGLFGLGVAGTNHYDFGTVFDAGTCPQNWHGCSSRYDPTNTGFYQSWFGWYETVATVPTNGIPTDAEWATKSECDITVGDVNGTANLVVQLAAADQTVWNAYHGDPEAQAAVAHGKIAFVPEAAPTVVKLAHGWFLTEFVLLANSDLGGGAPASAGTVGYPNVINATTDPGSITPAYEAIRLPSIIRFRYFPSSATLIAIYTASANGWTVVGEKKTTSPITITELDKMSTGVTVVETAL
jgi:hypothetical protein